MGLQTGFPLHSEHAVLLSATVAGERHEGMLFFYNASGLLYACPEADTERVRLGAAILLTQGQDVRVERLADFLGMDRTTLWRLRQRYEREGVEGVGYKYEGRPAHKLVGERLARAQALLDEGRSNRQVAGAVEVSEGAIRYGLRVGRLKRPGQKTKAQAKGSGPRERSDADRQCDGGVAVKRITERVGAAVGELEEAAPSFEVAESVARGGVMVVLPVLVAQGFFEVFGQVYGKLKNGFYGLNTMVATLVLMALLRIRTPEELSSYSPGEFGLLLGLDRAPEVKTVRRKLGELGMRGSSLELVEAFARQWLGDQGEEVAGFLYVDGHVRPYHGRTHKLPKTQVPRRRLSMPATTDFWVNDQMSDPLFFVTAPANDGLLSMLDGVLLPEIQNLLGPERRVTVVLDREGWSPKSFRRWHKAGIDVLTYRKGAYEPWPEDRFTPMSVEVAGRASPLRLAEGRLTLSNGFEVREVRCLDKKAHQVSIVTTRWDLSLPEVAARMFARWGQENFFRYMRQEFALDHLPAYAVEAADPDRLVPNPVHKEKAKELAGLKKERGRLLESLGQTTLNAEGSGQGSEETSGDLGRRIAEIEGRIGAMRLDLRALPKHVPVKELMEPHEIVRLEQERKRISDTIKMAAYRAETELAALVGPSLGHHHQDEARSFLREVFNLNADLVPDPEGRRLRVRLHGMANQRSNRALEDLCELLNGYQATYPGTSLRIVLEPPGVANPTTPCPVL